MEERRVDAWSLGAGVLLGFGVFFVCYWWIGAMTLSIALALVSGGVVALARWLGR